MIFRQITIETMTITVKKNIVQLNPSVQILYNIEITDNFIIFENKKV